MNSATLKIAIEVDDKGSVKIRQVGDEAVSAGKKASAAGNRTAKAANEVADAYKKAYGIIGTQTREVYGQMRLQYRADRDAFVQLTGDKKTAQAVYVKQMADLERANKKVRSQSSLAASAIRSVGVALSVGVVAHYTGEMIKLADAYTRSEGRLRLVTESQAEFGAVQQELYAISQRSRTEYLANVDVYSRLGQSTKELHLSQSELLTMEEALVKAFIVSGATGEETKATLIQLSQAFSSGVLRGEEFNSVSEQGGRVLQMLADYLGKTRGELRAMAEDGQLTADVLVDAILAGASGVNEEFDKMPMTVGQAMTTLENTWGSIISGANNSTGATNKIADSIIDLRDTIEDNREGIISLFSSIIDMAEFGARGIVGLANSVRGLSAVTAGVLDFGDYMTMNSKEMAQWLKDEASGVVYLKNQLKSAQEEVNQLNMGSAWTGSGENNSALATAQRRLETAKKALAEFESKQKQTIGTTKSATTAAREHAQQQGLAAKALSDLKKNYLPVEEAQRKYKSAVDQVNAALKAGQITQAQANSATAEAKKQLDKATGATAAHKKALGEQAKAAKEAQRLQKEQAREIKQTLDRLLPLRKAQEDYTESLGNLEVALAAGTISQSDYQLALTHLNREMEEAKRQANSYEQSMKDAERATQESALTINGTKIEIAIAQGQMSENEALPFQIDNLQKRLELQQQVLAEMKKGTPEEITAWNSQAEAISQATLQLAEYQQKLRLQDPYQGMIQGFKDVADQSYETGQSIREAIVRAFDSTSDALADFVVDFEADFSGLVNSILKDLARIAIQQSITSPIASALGSFFSMNAQGGVYATPGLHAYRNTVVDRPTIFPFARGIGIMGEDGAEAIMPLTRNKQGTLMGDASGFGTAPTVNVITNNYSSAQVSTETRQSADGMSIDVIVEMVEQKMQARVDRGYAAVAPRRPYL